MAKIIEIMGPVAVGKTTICKYLIDYYKNDNIFCFQGYGKRDPIGSYNKIIKDNRFKYILTETRIFYSLILREKGCTRESDNSLEFFSKTHKETGIKETLEKYLGLYMILNFRADANIILERKKHREKRGNYYSFLSNDSLKLLAIKNVMGYINTISRVCKRNGIYVYDIDASESIENNVERIRAILEFHRWKDENFYV